MTLKLWLAGLVTVLSLSNAVASTVATCEDKNDPFNEKNIMMIRTTSAGKIKLMQLTLGQTEYFTNLNGSLTCEAASRRGPIGGRANSTEIVCDLDTNTYASIHFQEKGKGSASVFVNNKLVDSFNKFECY